MSEIVYDVSPNGHYMELFARKNILLGAHNLNKNEELIAEIKEISEAKVYSKKDQSEVPVAVLVFTNGIKMAMNITTARVIAGLYGDNRNSWAGKSIQIYVGQAKNPAGKGTVPGLMVREKIPDTGESVEDYEASLRSTDSMDELITAWKKVPKHLMARIENVKDEMKEKLS